MITLEELEDLLGEDYMEQVRSVDPILDLLDRARLSAIREAEGYLRERYRIPDSATTPDHLKGHLSVAANYYFVAARPSARLDEALIERYQRALDFYREVSRGEHQLDLEPRISRDRSGRSPAAGHRKPRFEPVHDGRMDGMLPSEGLRCR